MKRIILLLTIASLNNSIAQDINLDWSSTVEGNSYEFGKDIITDSQGNIYSVGDYYDSIDIDPTLSTTTFISKGNSDVYIQKLDSQGNFIWGKTIGDLGSDEAYSINIDDADNIIISGYFQGNVDFDPNSGTQNLVSNGGNDVYVLKLDSNGDFIWAKAIGGTGNDHSNNTHVDNQNNIIIAGRFVNTVDFNPNSGTFNLTSNGSDDAFIVKLNANGDFIWAKSFGGSSGEEVLDIVTDVNRNLYLTGYFIDTCDFDPSPSTFKLISQGSTDVFIMKLFENGTFGWARSIGDVNSDKGKSIAIENNSLYIAGDYSLSPDFNTGTSTYTMTSGGNFDIFIEKMTLSGDYIWAKSIGGIGYQYVKSIAADVSGGVYLTGYFQDSCDFDPSSFEAIEIAKGSNDFFLTKISPTGNLVLAKTLGSFGSIILGTALHIDLSGVIYVTGYYKETIDFDPSAAIDISTSVNLMDAYLLKFNPDDLGIKEGHQSSVKLYPNPSNGKFRIDFGEELKEFDIQIVNMQSKIIFETSSHNKQSLNFSLNVPSGIYFLQISTEDITTSTKIIIE